MTLTLEPDVLPMKADETGIVRVGDTRHHAGIVDRVAPAWHDATADCRGLSFA